MHEDLQASDVHLVHLPLFHTNAQAYSVLATLWAGGTAVVLPRFSASRFWPISIKHRCSWASMIPFCLKALMTLEVPAAHHYRLWGAAACDLPTDPHFRVQTMGWWGMTETITHGIVSDLRWPSPSLTIGRPAPEYGIAIVDDDEVPVAQARAIEPGGSGQLLVRGIRALSLFQEYLGNAAATEGSFTADGWFRTGDRVDLLEDGSIRFGDRTKDMLKVGGENVAASEIERVIAAVPGVHVLGDATFSAPAMPKSGHMANQHAKVAAAAVIQLLKGEAVDHSPVMTNTCYSFVTAQEAVHVASVHQYDQAEKTFKTVAGSGGLSAEASQVEGRYALSWANNIWADMLAG